VKPVASVPVSSDSEPIKRARALYAGAAARLSARGMHVAPPRRIRLLVLPCYLPPFGNSVAPRKERDHETGKSQRTSWDRAQMPKTIQLSVESVEVEHVEDDPSLNPDARPHLVSIRRRPTAQSATSFSGPPMEENTDSVELPEPDMMETLTVTTVAIFFVDAASRPGSTLHDKRNALAWLLIGLAIVWAEVSVLLSLTIANSWRGCTHVNDYPDGECNLGTVCAQVVGSSGTYRMPLCIDCFYTSDRYGAEHPWAHVLSGEFGTNGTAQCEIQLLAPENIRFFGRRAFEHAGVAPANMSRDFRTCPHGSHST
jgi:hypothetical protein